MVSVQESATISTRSLRELADDANTLAGQAHLVWLRARNDVKKTLTADNGNIIYSGSLTSVIKSLWPRLSRSDVSEEMNTFRSDIYAFLRATGNGVCIQRGTTAKAAVRWELSPSWIEPSGAVVIRQGRRSTAVKATYAESKLTPHEAGEDRQPAPVEVRHVTPPKDGKMTAVAEPKVDGLARRDQAFESQRQAKAKEHSDAVELTAMALAEATQPLTAKEVAKLIGLYESTARKILNELVAANRASTRKETAEEKVVRYGASGPSVRSALYAAGDTVPERTVREAVPGVIADPTRSRELRKRAARKGRNAEAVLHVMSTKRFERSGNIIKKARVPSGSTTCTFKQLLEDGKIEVREIKQGERIISEYRKIDLTPVVAAAAPAAPSLVVETTSDDPRAQIIALIDQLSGGAETAALRARNAELERELTEAKERITELETALAPLRGVLGGI